MDRPSAETEEAAVVAGRSLVGRGDSPSERRPIDAEVVVGDGVSVGDEDFGPASAR